MTEKLGYFVSDATEGPTSQFVKYQCGVARNYESFRQWAEALAKEDPKNNLMLQYAKAWERDREQEEVRCPHCEWIIK